MREDADADDDGCDNDDEDDECLITHDAGSQLPGQRKGVLCVTNANLRCPSNMKTDRLPKLQQAFPVLLQ